MSAARSQAQFECDQHLPEDDARSALPCEISIAEESPFVAHLCVACALMYERAGGNVTRLDR